MNKSELLKELWALEAAEPTTQVTAPSDIYPLLLSYANKKQEYFIAISLDGAHKIIRKREISKGILNRTIVHPREVFVGAIKDHAASILIAHNHPSGNYEPSREDINLTERLKKAGEILGITILDHIIISKTGNYSFLENGDL